MTQEYQAIDGPFYAPNKVRRVRIEREHDMPGFFRCTDLDTGETLAVHRQKLMTPPPAPAAAGEGANAS